MERFKSYQIGDVVRVYPAKAGPDGNEGIHTVVNTSGDDYALARGQVSAEAIATGHYDVWIHARRIKRAHAGVFTTYHVLSNEEGTILGVYGAAIRDHAITRGKAIALGSGARVALHTITSETKPRVHGSISMRGEIEWL